MKGTMAKLIHIQTSPRGSRSASQSVATGFVGFSDIREIFVEPTTIPISAWFGKFSLFRRCCTSLTEISAPESLGLPARKRFFPNYDPSPTATIPKLSIPMQTMKMNTTTCERGSTESQRPCSARRQQHHLAFSSRDLALLNSDEHQFKHMKTIRKTMSAIIPCTESHAGQLQTRLMLL